MSDLLGKMFGKERMPPKAGVKIQRLRKLNREIKELEDANVSVPAKLTNERDTLEKDLREMNPTTGKKPSMESSGGKVKKYMGGGKVYASHNKRYAHGGKVSGRKAKYNG